MKRAPRILRRLCLAALLPALLTLTCSEADVTAPARPDFSVSAGSAALVDEVAGENQTERVGLAVGVDPTVRVTDAAGAPVAGVEVRFEVTAGGGTLWAPGGSTHRDEIVVVTDGDGLASPRAWWLGQLAGRQELHAWVEGLSPAIFWATAVLDPTDVPASAMSLVIVGGDGQTEAAGTYVGEDPAVRVTDAAGNPLGGVSVAFVASGDGSAEGSPASTNAEGVASVDWRLATKAGENMLAASIEGGPSVVFTATGAPGAVGGGSGEIAKVEGDDQTVEPRTEVAVPPRVRVTDEHGNGVPGVVVAFDIALGGGTVTGSPAVTDAGGYAGVRAWKVGSAEGPTWLTATAGGVGSVTFRATVESDDPPPTPDPIAFVGGETSAAAGTPGSVDVPAGVQAGDVLLAFATADFGGTFTTPGGWQVVETDTRAALYLRVADGTEPATYAFSNTANPVFATIVAYRNVDGGSPIDAQTDGIVDLSSVTTTVSNTMLVAFWASNHVLSFTLPAGMTQRVGTTFADGVGAGADGGDRTIRVADESFAGPGATGDRDPSILHSSLPAAGNAYLVALTPEDGV